MSACMGNVGKFLFRRSGVGAVSESILCRVMQIIQHALNRLARPPSLSLAHAHEFNYDRHVDISYPGIKLKLVIDGGDFETKILINEHDNHSPSRLLEA